MRALLLVAFSMLFVVALATSGPEASVAQEGLEWGAVPQPQGGPAPASDPPAPAPLPDKETGAGDRGAGLAVVVPPANDDFALRRYASTPYTVAQSTVGADVQLGEPTLCGDASIGSTLWYEWRAPADGLYMMTTSGSDFDTVISVYDIEFNQIACNDDAGAGLLSVVRFEAQGGEAYFLQAGGFGTNQGNLQLLLAPVVGLQDDYGDTYGPGVHDVLKAEATITWTQSEEKSLLLRFEFADRVSAPSVGGDGVVNGYIDLDTDLNSTTGTAPLRNGSSGPYPAVSLGSEYFLALSHEALNPGTVALHSTSSGFLGPVPIAFRLRGFTIEVPWGDIGSPSDVAYAAVFGTWAEPTDVVPNADPAPIAGCSAPWFADPELDGQCFGVGGLWHEEGDAQPGGTYGTTLAYNQNCTGPGTTGCNFDTGARNFGLAVSPVLGPLPSGASVWFTSVHSSEDGCFYDATTVQANLGLLDLIGEPGGASISGQNICGGNGVAHDVIAGLLAGTNSITFGFDTLDQEFNDGAGQFLDAIVICPPEIRCDTDSDFCADDAELGTDESFGGLRNWYDRWDFYDVNGNGNVDLSDTLAILSAFGLTPGTPGYEQLFDRMVLDSNEPWRSAAATGTAVGIDLNDALANLSQFGHNCVE